jgi:hypothetical protein
MSKIGRNDPCPCGSGRKYKQCHGGAAANDEAPEPDHAHAVERAIHWLHDRHRKAFGEALVEFVEDGLSDGADLGELDEDTLRSVQANAAEWLLAEGELQLRGRWIDVQELLLGPNGPAFTPAQRAWIAEMGRAPLRLYTLTDVRRGEGFTLVDALDTTAEPLVVQERSGSRSGEPGMLIGARLMHVGGHIELSGAVYPFERARAAGALESAKRSISFANVEEDRKIALSTSIFESWLAQFFTEPSMPVVMDASTGEPMLLVTDHYEVRDAAVLERALAACPDVQGNAAEGWVRVQPQGEEPPGGDFVRHALRINPGKTAGRIEVFYRTQGLADAGRPWFEGVAGEAVRHLSREITDPTSRAALDAAVPHNEGGAARQPDLTPEQMTEVMTQVLHRTYARWSDEPTPALEGRTPRQALATAAGEERVRGLIRMYEHAETEQARRDRRAAVSYDFLWKQIGLARGA